jgi:predicted negative regulator of RcsB-dependent stress response
MLENIKNFWQEFKVAIVAGALALAYLIGKNRGKENEKARQNKAVLENVSRADTARARLRNPDAVRRLHDRYKRE